MSFTPIEPHTVDLILRYIAPPSNLQPLPPHLLSNSLLQRHHFLQISTESPKDYLAWPSESQSESVNLLESHPFIDSPSAYQSRYSSDGDYAYAHVNVTPTREQGLRLIFQWDVSSGSWRYHDLNLMPFPSGSTSFDRDTQVSTPDKTLETPPLIVSLDSPTTNNDDDDGSYWNAYGDDHEPYSSSHLASEPSSEDAYWAQYSSVHGSADSTLPSPLPQTGNKKILFGEEATPSYRDVTRNQPVSIPVSTFLPGREPSPTALAHLLSSISPRDPTYNSSYTPPGAGSPIGVHSEYGFSLSTDDMDKRFVLQGNGLEGGITQSKHDIPSKLTGVSTFMRSTTDDGSQSLQVEPTDDAALRAIIKGVYLLWKDRKRTGENKDQFLQIVREAVEVP